MLIEMEIDEGYTALGEYLRMTDSLFRYDADHSWFSSGMTMDDGGEYVKFKQIEGYLINLADALEEIKHLREVRDAR